MEERGLRNNLVLNLESVDGLPGGPELKNMRIFEYIANVYFSGTNVHSFHHRTCDPKDKIQCIFPQTMLSKANTCQGHLVN